MFKFISFFMVTFMGWSALAEQEPGISKKLAVTRAQQIADVAYGLRFKIPAKPLAAIDGEVRVSFSLKKADKPVVLDAQAGVVIHSATVNGKGLDAKAVNDHLEIPKILLKSGANEVLLKFTAGNGGLYRRDDYMFTLFVPERASKTFPCFDQPDLKAKFDLTLVLPQDWVAVSQSPVRSDNSIDGWRTVNFKTSAPTSTYLMAFAAGKFSQVARKVDGRSITMYHRESDTKKVERNLDAIFDSHRKSIQWMEEYTGIKYPFAKFDIVLLPAFPFGGMEHPGSIFYRDKSLFLDESATQSQFLQRANVIAHETAHMWFGDLVTMRWFDDVWLKEVFANFLADKIVNPWFPKLNHDVRFFLGHYPHAYSVDRTAGANAIWQPLDNLNRASSLYGNIIYHKSPIVMRQLERLLGERGFRKALKHYLNKHKFGNASWEELLSLMKAQRPSLMQWNKDWILTAGRPAFTLKHEEHRLEISVNPAWLQTLELAADSFSKSVMVDRKGWKRSYTIPLLQTSAKDPGYGIFRHDPPLLERLIAQIPITTDENLRSVMWVNLWENTLERTVDPLKVVQLAIKALPKEAQEQIINYVLGCVQTIYWSLLAESKRADVSPSLEAMLLGQVKSETNSVTIRYAYWKAYVNLVRSEGGLALLHNVWSRKTELPGLIFSERDEMTMAYALALRRNQKDWKAAKKIVAAQIEKLGDPERKKEFQFVAAAIFGHQKDRDKMFAKLLTPEGRQNEPWAQEAAALLHHPLNGDSSQKYVAPSLAALESIKRTTGIFYPTEWLHATLSMHINAETKRAVDEYLVAHPELEAGLRQKVLQAADLVQRFAR